MHINQKHLGVLLNYSVLRPLPGVSVSVDPPNKFLGAAVAGLGYSPTAWVRTLSHNFVWVSLAVVQRYSTGPVSVAILLKYSPLSLIAHTFAIYLSHVFIFLL